MKKEGMAESLCCAEKEHVKIDLLYEERQYGIDPLL